MLEYNFGLNQLVYYVYFRSKKLLKMADYQPSEIVDMNVFLGKWDGNYKRATSIPFFY